MAKLTIASMLLAAADASPGSGRSTPASRKHAPTPPPAEEEEAPVDEEELMSLVSTHANEGEMVAYMRAMQSRGLEMAPKVGGALKDGQSVHGVFLGFGVRSFKPREDEVRLAAKLGEAVKLRTEPTYILDLGRGGVRAPWEFTLAHDLKRQFGYDPETKESKKCTPGAEVSVTRTGTRRLDNGNTVGDYTSFIQTPESMAAARAKARS